MIEVEFVIEYSPSLFQERLVILYEQGYRVNFFNVGGGSNPFYAAVLEKNPLLAP